MPPEWIDYNGHMNDAYYFMAFTEATEAFLDHVGLGAAYRARTGSGIYTAESHLCFLSGVVGGAVLAYQTQLLGHDAKRLHVFHRMSDSGTLVATCELMFLHVSGERVAPMPPEAVAAVDALAVSHAALPRPERAGRRVAMPQRVLRVFTERALRSGGLRSGGLRSGGLRSGGLRGGPFTKVTSAGPTRATAGRATGGSTATPRRAAGLAGASGSGARRVPSAGRRAGQVRVTEPPAWSVPGVPLAWAHRPHRARRPWPGGWPTARARVMTAQVPMAPRNSGRLRLPPRAAAARPGDRPG